MVYKRYVKKKVNGEWKKFGPYYYESYRDKDGKTCSRYLPDYKPKRTVTRNNFHLHPYVWVLFSIVVLIIVGALVFNYNSLNSQEGFSVSSFSKNVYGKITGFVTEDGNEEVSVPVEDEQGSPSSEENTVKIDDEGPESEVNIEEADSEEEASAQEEIPEEIIEDEIEEGVEEVIVEVENDEGGVVENETEDVVIENETQEVVENNASESEVVENETIVENNETDEITGEDFEEGGGGFVANQTNESNFVSNASNVTEINGTNSSLINSSVVLGNLVTDVEVVQYGAVLGKPVRWQKKVKVLEGESSYGLRIDLGDSAGNVSVKKKKGEDEEEINVIVKNEKEIGEEDENVVGIIFDFFLSLFRLTGKAVGDSSSDNVSVEINLPVARDDEFVVEYYTEAPYSVEEEFDSYKEVKVIGSETVHYSDVLIFSVVDEGWRVRDSNQLQIYWEEGDQNLEVTNLVDTDSNGIFDYVEWVAPQLSNQTFRLILITKALHLDSNRGFISDIYSEVKDLDGVFSEEINSGEYVRVTFERNLTNRNDITIYPRIISGNPRIEIYEVNGTDLVNEFVSIENETLNKVYLDFLNGSQDTFDLLVLDGSVSFDYIVDPTGACSGGACYFDDSYILADIEVCEVGFGGTCQPNDEGSQLKWDVTDLCDGSLDTITSAYVQFYIGAKQGAPDNDYRVWRITDQTWTEATGYATIAAQTTANQQDGTMTSTAVSTYTNLSVLSQIQAACTAGESNFTVRFEDVDYLISTIDETTDTTLLRHGYANFFGAAYFTFRSREYATAAQRPNLFVTYTEASNPPQWFSNSTNSTKSGSPVEHRVYWTGDSDFSGYYFSFDNGNGTFINNSFAAISGTTNWTNITKVVNSTVGSNIRWQVYLNDSTNTWNATSIFTYTTTASEPPTHSNPSLVNSPSATDFVNLTCTNVSTSDPEGDSVANVYNWLVNDTPVMLINMPFEVNASSAGDLVEDYSGNDADGVILDDSLTWTSEGVLGGAYDFSSTGRVDISNESIDIGDNFTINFWFNHADTTDDVFSKGDNTEGVYVGFLGLGNALYTYLGGSSYSYLAPSAGTWSMYTLACDAQGCDIYSEGLLITSTALTPSGHDNHNITLGGSVIFGYEGDFDELKIFNRTLSSEQIYQLYLEGDGGLTDSTISLRETSVGENWTCEVTPVDSYVNGETKINYTMIVSGVPTQDNPILVPYPSYISSDLVCANSSTGDPEGYVVNNIYNWKINNTPAMLLNMPFETDENRTLPNMIRDYSGNSNNGTLGEGSASAAPKWVSGKVGGAYYFDGGDYINIEKSSSLNHTYNFSVDLWFNSTNVNEGYIFNNYDGGTVSLGDFLIYLLNGRLVVGIDNVDLFYSASSLENSTWYHVAYKNDGINEYLYIDGALDNTTSVTAAGPHLNNSDNFSIGALSGGGNYFEGEIDNIRFWNRSLTTEQINRLYYEGINSVLNSTIVSEELTVGQNWTCEVVPNNKYGDGDLKHNSTLINFCLNVGTSTILSSDTSACYIFDQDNGILDCASYKIEVGSTVRAVNSTSQDNVTLKNCRIYNTQYPIYFETTNNSLLDNVTIFNSTDWTTEDVEVIGAQFVASVNNTIDDLNMSVLFANSSSMTNCYVGKSYGIWFSSSSDNNTIRDSTIYSVNGEQQGYEQESCVSSIRPQLGRSVVSEGSENVSIFNTTLDDGYYGAYVGSVSNSFNISNATVSNFDLYGAYFTATAYAFIENSKFERNDKHTHFVSSSNYPTVRGNIFSYGGRAFYELIIGAKLHNNVFEHISVSDADDGVVNFAGPGIGSIHKNNFNNITTTSPSSAVFYTAYQVNSSFTTMTDVDTGYSFAGSNAKNSQVYHGSLVANDNTTIVKSGATNVSFYNTTLEKNQVYVFGTGEFFSYYYVKGNATTQISSPVSGASVYVRNSTGLGVVENYSETDAGGLTPWITLFTYEKYSGSSTNHSPYNVTANKTGYSYFTQNFSIDESQILDLSLQTPYIDAYVPVSDSFSIYEPNNQTFSIATVNETPVTINWYVNGTEQVDYLNLTQFLWWGNYSQAGVYEVVVNISNAAGWDTQTWIMTILDTPPRVGLSVIYPVLNPQNATFHDFLNVTLNVTCLAGDDCGAVNVTLWGNSSIISPVANTTPFYTNASTNPLTTSSLSSGQSETINFWVNATGFVGYTYVFYSQANLTNDLSVGNTTDTFNMTIIEQVVSVAIDLSPKLLNQINWTLLTLPIYNQSAEGNNGTGISEYWVNVSVSGGTADLYVKADGNLTTSGGDILVLANETFSYNSTNSSVPSLQKYPLTTVYSDNPIGTGITDGTLVYLKFFLNAPAGQAAGTYNNSLSFKGVPNGDAP